MVEEGKTQMLLKAEYLSIYNSWTNHRYFQFMEFKEESLLARLLAFLWSPLFWGVVVSLTLLEGTDQELYRHIQYHFVLFNGWWDFVQFSRKIAFQTTMQVRWESQTCSMGVKGQEWSRDSAPLSINLVSVLYQSGYVFWEWGLTCAVQKRQVFPGFDTCTSIVWEFSSAWWVIVMYAENWINTVTLLTSHRHCMDVMVYLMFTAQNIKKKKKKRNPIKIWFTYQNLIKIALIPGPVVPSQKGDPVHYISYFVQSRVCKKSPMS